MAQFPSDAECERMAQEQIAQTEPANRQRFVPRHLALKMGRDRATRWLDAKDADEDESQGDGAIMARMLGLQEK